MPTECDVMLIGRMTALTAMPEKTLSRSSLDRYLPAGLAYLTEQLDRAQVLVR